MSREKNKVVLCLNGEYPLDGVSPFINAPELEALFIRMTLQVAELAEARWAVEMLRKMEAASKLPESLLATRAVRLVHEAAAYRRGMVAADNATLLIDIPKLPAKDRESAKNRYDRLKELNICVRCGNEPAIAEEIYGLACKTRRAELRRKKQKETELRRRQAEIANELRSLEASPPRRPKSGEGSLEVTSPS